MRWSLPLVLVLIGVPEPIGVSGLGLPGQSQPQRPSVRDLLG